MKNKKKKEVNRDRKSGALYAFILEFIVDLLTDGPASYRLTEEELEIHENKSDKYYKLKKFLSQIFAALVAIAILYLIIKFQYKIK